MSVPAATAESNRVQAERLRLGGKNAGGDGVAGAAGVHGAFA